MEKSWAPLRTPKSTPHSINNKLWITVAALFLISTVAYQHSLSGAATPQLLAPRLPALGASLLVASIAASAQLWLLFLHPKSSKFHVCVSTLAQIVIFAAFYFLDHGTSIVHHGAYNALIFCVMTIPLNLLTGSVLLWYYLASRRFWSQALVFAIFSIISISVFALHSKEQLRYGFFHRDLFPSTVAEAIDVCEWKDSIPWFDMIPVRMNIFTGPMVCPPLSFAAYIDHDYLTIDCDSGARPSLSWTNNDTGMSFGPMYSILPRTEHWGLSEKVATGNSGPVRLQEAVLSFVEANIRTYSGPVSLDFTTESVVAFCGTFDPIFVHRTVPHDRDASLPDRRVINSSAIDSGSLNVITIFLDSVSRSQFHRQLPRTRRVLESMTSGLDSSSRLYEFSRYHTVGLNTGPNTRALWAGLGDDNEVSDGVPGVPLWEHYKTIGYATGSIDSMCQDWRARYMPDRSDQGNITIPTVHHEALAWSCLPPHLPRNRDYGNFAGPYSIKAHCISGTHVAWHQLDWVDQFISTYREVDRPYYVQASFMEGHEGSGAVLSTLDERLAGFLDPRSSSFDWKNTAVVLVSDHGALMGLKYAFSKNGKVEAANPMAIMILPDMFLDESRRRARLESAQGKLVTAFDLHETIKGFAKEDNSPRRDRANSDAEKHVITRGHDLSRGDIPNRTCAQAGIEQWRCCCI